MSDHLDPGYAAAAQSRPERRSPREARREMAWALVGLLLVGAVFGVAASRLEVRQSGSPGVGSDIADSVRDAETRSEALEVTRGQLADTVESMRATTLQSDTEGSAVLESLRSLEYAAGTENLVGEGIVVTITEPPSPANLSDAAGRPRGDSTAAVLDRDIQSVVNSLWVSGAEAVAVDDVRIGPNVTIRQAGGAMLVDNRPVFSPYSISAVGSSSQLQARFSVSDAQLRMSAIAQLYRVGFEVVAEDVIELPPATVRAVRSAQREGVR